MKKSFLKKFFDKLKFERKSYSVELDNLIEKLEKKRDKIRKKLESEKSPTQIKSYKLELKILKNQFQIRNRLKLTKLINKNQRNLTLKVKNRYLLIRQNMKYKEMI